MDAYLRQQTGQMTQFFSTAYNGAVAKTVAGYQAAHKYRKERIVPAVQDSYAKSVALAKKTGVAARDLFGKSWTKVKNPHPAVKNIYKGVLLSGAMLVGGTGFFALMSKIGSPVRGQPYDTYREGQATIKVYSGKNMAFYEEGNAYVMVDYNRKYGCSGVLSQMPAWLAAGDNPSNYSMKFCRDFGAAAQDVPEINERSVHLQKYMDLSKQKQQEKAATKPIPANQRR